MLGQGIYKLDQLIATESIYRDLVHIVKKILSKLTGNDISISDELISPIKSLTNNDSLEKFKVNRPSIVKLLISLLFGVSKCDTPVSNNEFKQIINTFLIPQLWKNEILYNKALLKKDLQVYCHDGLDPKAKVYDYLFQVQVNAVLVKG